MVDTIFGSDITLVSVEPRSFPQMNEMKMRELIQPHLAENGGIVKAFSFPSGSVAR